MLTTLTKNDIVTLKLRGSEEIVAKLKVAPSEASSYLELSQPLQILPTGNGQIGTMPYIVTIDDNQTVYIPVDYIVHVGLTVDAIKNMYIQRTTGIDMSGAGPSSIITG